MKIYSNDAHISIKEMKSISETTIAVTPLQRPTVETLTDCYTEIQIYKRSLRETQNHQQWFSKKKILEEINE